VTAAVRLVPKPVILTVRLPAVPAYTTVAVDWLLFTATDCVVGLGEYWAPPRFTSVAVTA
jgi:hypothetical protein